MSFIYRYCYFYNDTSTTQIYTYRHTLSQHDALPIYADRWIAPPGLDAAQVGHVDLSTQRCGRRSLSTYSWLNCPKRCCCAPKHRLRCCDRSSLAMATTSSWKQKAFCGTCRSDERREGKECVSRCRYRWKQKH